MRFKGLFPRSQAQHRKPGNDTRQRGKIKAGRRAATLATVAALSLSGCGFDAKRPEVGVIGYIQGFGGMVVADEPRAALVGQDILSAGGTAVDGAVGLAMTLAVTLPSRAGLGGGGSCVIYDQPSNTAEVASFPIGQPATLPVGAHGAVGVPGLVRGLFLMHAKYGRVRWEQLIIPSENLARFRFQVSRALSMDLRQFGDRLNADPAARRLFSTDGGQLAGEGQFLQALDLSAALSRVRAMPGEFYNGALARQIVDAAQSSGGAAFGFGDLRGYKPAWLKPVDVPVGNEIAHFAPPPSGGVVAAQMTGMLNRDDIFADAPVIVRPHLVAEAALRAYADRGVWLGMGGGSTVPANDLVSDQRLAQLAASLNTERHIPPRGNLRPIDAAPASTGFVIVDGEGSAVSCTLSMGQPFGTGKSATGSGFLFAPAGDVQGQASYAMAPVVVANHNVSEFWFAGAASGSPAAPSALAQVMGNVLMGQESLANAISARRVHAGTSGMTVFLERGAPAIKNELERRGQSVLEVDGLSLVNGIYCYKGHPSHSENCVRGNDPRGYGLAVTVGEGL